MPSLIHTQKIYPLALFLSLFGILVLIADFGFDQSSSLQQYIHFYYFATLSIGVVATTSRYITQNKKKEIQVLIFDGLSILFTLYLIKTYLFAHITHLEALYDKHLFKLGIVLMFIREYSELTINYKRTYLNPAQLFIISFLVIILLGAVLLMLPNATHQGIGFIDALFTATSAVCVTGLIVVDTGTYFTKFGQVIILCLIQIGGLGILTFASYFSYFFKGETSYENQVSLSDMTSSQKLGEVFSTLKQVLLITFVIESAGAIFIYYTLPSSLFSTVYERVFFSVFHSISAFCNAGFSTLYNGIYELEYRYNYTLHLLLIALFVLGGLGFSIVSNLVYYIKQQIYYRLFWSREHNHQYQPWVLNINSRITLITTVILCVVGSLLFYVLEYNNTLAEHGTWGKIVTAIFGGTTPRTAGFNTIDMTALHFSTVMLIILLMWIGASPASTGGGIKTSTFALAVLNIISLAKGKTKIEIYRREIAEISIRRAFATMTLSLVAIGIGVFGISIFDAEKDLLGIAFECFSAYSTVGLSIGLTASLSPESKLIITLLMFIGRVSMLTIVIALVRKEKYTNYRYPIEEITIN